ncbi:MAG: RDD family protein [Sulfurovum sp.]|nr:MAG: RDD family protein [Sulfurovum sp.]
MIEIASLPIANMQKRTIAFVIDEMAVTLLLLIIFYPQLSEIASHIPSVVTNESVDVVKSEMNEFSVNNLLFIITLKIMYHTFFVWQNGMTLGKYMMKIKVVQLSTKRTPTLPISLLRAMLRIISETFFYLGFLLAFFLPLNQTLHDKLSNCVVTDV